MDIDFKEELTAGRPVVRGGGGGIDEGDQDQEGEGFSKVKEKPPPGEMVDKAVMKQDLQHFTTGRDPASFMSTSRLKKHYFHKASL